MTRKLVNTALLANSFRGTEGIKEICFIGIGGIGMSALAKFFFERGVTVSGYDKTPSALTREMEASGMLIHYEDDLKQVRKETDLVVYTPAIPAEHKELNWYRNNGFTVWKRSDLLQRITDRSLNICIAGTHGKTTTSTMVAHILRDSGFGCNAFLGGIAANYGTNHWSSETNCCVVEADEYDRSFLKLRPHLALITAMDPDHLDIYGTVEAMEQAFIDFSGLVSEEGLLVYKYGLKRAADLKAKQQLSYHLRDERADCYATDLKVTEGAYVFSVVVKGEKIEGLQLPMGGLHNIENAVAAITMASALGLEPARIAKALASFKGVQRRFERVCDEKGIVLIDDYAHHPAELKALISGVRSIYGSSPCTVVFQPHLFTRTRDLANEFAEALDEADSVVLLPIYPARELPIEGVSSDMIAKQMKKAAVRQLDAKNLLIWIEEEFVKQNATDKKILITAGAGDIDRLPGLIKNILSKS